MRSSTSDNDGKTPEAVVPGSGAGWRFFVLSFLLIANAVLVLLLIYQQRFVSMSIGTYLWFVWDFVSLWAGRAVTIAGAVIPIWIALSRRKSASGAPRRRHRKTTEEIAASVAAAVARILKKPFVFILSCGVLALPIPFLVQAILHTTMPFPVPPSTVAISKDGSEIYVAYQDGDVHGKLLIFESSSGKETRTPVDIGGKPHRITVGRNGHVYVVDENQDTVTEVDPETRTIKATFSVHPLHLPHTAVLSPDQRRLYVAVAEPTPQGVIKVIELDEKKGYPSHVIEGVNCPEGLAISRDGRKLYVATQCGAGKDPVFVIDTRSETVKAIPGFAVGLDLALADEGKRLYVARGGPPQLSVIDTATEKELPEEVLRFGDAEHPEAPGAFGTTPDGRYLLVGLDSSVEIINPESHKRTEIRLGSPPAGIAVGTPSKSMKEAVCYVWLPEERRLFFTGLSGLLPQ